MRRGDKLEALADLPKRDPRHRQIRGFNHTFADYMAQARIMLAKVQTGNAASKRKGKGKGIVFLLTDAGNAYVEHERAKLAGGDLDVHYVAGGGQPDYDWVSGEKFDADPTKATDEMIDLLLALEKNGDGTAEERVAAHPRLVSELALAAGAIEDPKSIRSLAALARTLARRE